MIRGQPNRICSMLLIIMCLLFYYSAHVGAEEERRPQLTLQEAVDRAQKRNHSVREAELEKDKAREEKHKATDKLRDSYEHLTPEYEEDHRRVVMAELNYQMKSSEEIAARNNLEAEVLEKYGEVLVAEKNVELAKQELAVEEWEYKAARAGRKHGMLSSMELDRAASVVEQKCSALNRAQQDLDKAYVNLNALKGKPLERRSELVTELPYRSLEIRSMNAEINRAVDSSEDLYALSRYVQIQRQELRLFFVDRDIKEKEIELAELDEAKAESEIRKRVRLFCKDILSLEEKIATTEENVSQAEQAYQAAQLRHEMGKDSKGDVIQAEAEVQAARQELVELQYSHISATAAYRNLTGRTIVPVENKW